MKLLSQQQGEISEFLRLLEHDNQGAWDGLLSLVYDELKRRAHNQLFRERSDHTLNTTALVHEAYLRLAEQDLGSLRNSAHFFWLASEMMRRILVDHARTRRSEKHGGSVEIIPLEQELQIAIDDSEVDILSLDEALSKLAKVDTQQAKVVELRYFGGCSIEETARALEISVATVKRDWAVAKAWLKRELSSEK